MRLASLPDGSRDGHLVIVSADGSRYERAPSPYVTLQAAVDHWLDAEPALRAIAAGLDADRTGAPLAGLRPLAPLPRAFQWIDASGYLSHMERVRRARGAGMPPNAHLEPVIYQGLSDRNLACDDDIPSEPAWGTDIEAEIAVIVGDVPAGASRQQALAAIRLVVLVNDVSLRTLIPPELAKGFGFFHSKPSSAFGPFAATLDEFGADWVDGRLFGSLRVAVNGEGIGDLRTGVDQDFDFPAIIQYACRTRSLCAGTIVGAGTVSNRDEARGVACLVEKRTLEQLHGRAPLSGYLQVGDRIEIAFGDSHGRATLGSIRQAVIAPTVLDA